MSTKQTQKKWRDTVHHKYFSNNYDYEPTESIDDEDEDLSDLLSALSTIKEDTGK